MRLPFSKTDLTSKVSSGLHAMISWNSLPKRTVDPISIGTLRKDIYLKRKKCTRLCLESRAVGLIEKQNFLPCSIVL